MIPLSARTRTYLRENDWTPLLALTEATTDEAERFREAAASLSTSLQRDLGLRQGPLQTEPFGDSIRIRATGISGTLRVGHLTLDVAPKFIEAGTAHASWQRSLFNILGRTRKSRLSYSRASHLSKSPLSFVDHLALAYLDALETGLATEPIHTYSLREDRLPVLRGRLNIQRQLASLFDRPHLLECDFDELNTDNSFNHLLRWACARLALLVRDTATRSRLQAMGWLLPGISGLPRPPSQLPLVVPPQYRAWSEAIDIASLIAAGKSHSLRRGLVSGYGLILGMERVFEEFVESTVSQAVRLLAIRDLEVRRQDTTPYAEPTQPGMRRYYTRPDNVVYREGEPALVVDAKYKKLAEAEEGLLKKPRNSDVYQLVGSMTAHDCHRGLLLYPKIAGDVDLGDGRLRTWLVDAFDEKLSIGALALDLTDVQTAGDLRRLDEKIAELLALSLQVERNTDRVASRSA